MAETRHELAAPAILDPGVILRLQMNLGEQDGMLQIEGYIDRDSHQSEYDALADKMRKTALRQRAMQMLPNLRRQLENIEHKDGENRKRLAELEAREKAGDEIRDMKVAELMAARQQRHDDAYAEHAITRRGAFKPQGAQAAELARFQKDIDAIEEGRAKEHAQLEEQRATLKNELKDGARLIEQCKLLIVEQEALAGSAANDG